MQEHSKTRKVEVAGLRAGSDRKTTRKYLGLIGVPAAPSAACIPNGRTKVRAHSGQTNC
ncbi:MAG: hypothetical protein ACI8X5_000497 [Planctomycetota bacterium]|jgi:hypothetical protein